MNKKIKLSKLAKEVLKESNDKKLASILTNAKQCNKELDALMKKNFLEVANHSKRR